MVGIRTKALRSLTWWLVVISVSACGDPGAPDDPWRGEIVAIADWRDCPELMQECDLEFVRLAVDATRSIRDTDPVDAERFGIVLTTDAAYQVTDYLATEREAALLIVSDGKVVASVRDPLRWGGVNYVFETEYGAAEDLRRSIDETLP